MAKGSTSYTLAAATHWASLTLVGCSILGGCILGWPAFLLGACVEATVLWVLPDIAPFRAAVDKANVLNVLYQQRLFYLRELWGVGAPEPKGLLSGLFTDAPISWRELVPSYGDADRDRFRRLIQIHESLINLSTIRPDVVTPAHLVRVDEGINAYLGLLYSAQAIDGNLRGLQKEHLATEFERVKQLAGNADRSTQIVLQERLRTLKDKVDSIPALENRKGLALAQAEAVAYRLETFHGQMQSSQAPGVEVSTMLDGLVDRYDLLQADFDKADIAQSGTGLPALTVSDPALWSDLEAKLSTGEPIAEPVSVSPQVPRVRRVR